MDKIVSYRGIVNRGSRLDIKKILAIIYFKLDIRGK